MPEEIRKQFYKEVREAMETPTDGYCNNCTCRVPCGSNETEIVARMWEIVNKYNSILGAE